MQRVKISCILVHFPLLIFIYIIFIYRIYRHQYLGDFNNYAITRLDRIDMLIYNLYIIHVYANHLLCNYSTCTRSYKMDRIDCDATFKMAFFFSLKADTTQRIYPRLRMKSYLLSCRCFYFQVKRRCYRNLNEHCFPNFVSN